MNAVIDTNVWVSGLINRNGMPARVLDAYRDLRFTVVTSEPLLEASKWRIARRRYLNPVYLPFEVTGVR